LYRRTYHEMSGDALVAQSLKDKSVSMKVYLIIGNIENLHEDWITLDVIYEHPEKYIMEAFLPIVNFRRYKAFDNTAIRELYSLLRAAVIGAKSDSLLKMLFTEQSLAIIMGMVLATDQKQ
jgi:hypothetical protein